MGKHGGKVDSGTAQRMSSGFGSPHCVGSVIPTFPFSFTNTEMAPVLLQVSLLWDWHQRDQCILPLCLFWKGPDKVE